MSHEHILHIWQRQDVSGMRTSQTLHTDKTGIQHVQGGRHVEVTLSLFIFSLPSFTDYKSPNRPWTKVLQVLPTSIGQGIL